MFSYVVNTPGQAKRGHGVGEVNTSLLPLFSQTDFSKKVSFENLSNVILITQGLKGSCFKSFKDFSLV